MTTEPVEKIYGIRVSDWIASVPGELPRDAVGLWQIVPAGMIRFELTGAALVDYVRRNVFALVDAGAVPVRSGGETGYEWVQVRQFGTSREEIAAATIAEWHRVGDDPAKLTSSIWFALPRVGQKYVKMDSSPAATAT